MSTVGYIAVIGPGESASRDAIADATEMGTLIAQRGWITLTGGRRTGVMGGSDFGMSDAALNPSIRASLLTNAMAAIAHHYPQAIRIRPRLCP